MIARGHSPIHTLKWCYIVMTIVTVEVNKIFGIYGTFPTQGLQSHKVYTNFKRIILCKMCQYSVHHAKC